MHYRFHIPEVPISLMFYYMSISRVRYPVWSTIFTTTEKKKSKDAFLKWILRNSRSTLVAHFYLPCYFSWIPWSLLSLFSSLWFSFDECYYCSCNMEVKGWAYLSLLVIWYVVYTNLWMNKKRRIRLILFIDGSKIYEFSSAHDV